MDYILLELFIIAIGCMIVAAMYFVNRAAIVVGSYLNVKLRPKHSKLYQFKSHVNHQTIIWCELVAIGAILMVLALHNFSFIQMEPVVKTVCLLVGMAILFATFIKVNIDLIEMTEVFVNIREFYNVKIETSDYTDGLNRFERKAIRDFENYRALATRVYRLVK